MTFLKIEDMSLKINEHKTILNNLTFSIEEGEHLILIGANGSGKSSLIKCIQGFYKPSCGKISYPGFYVEQSCQDNISTLTQNAEESLFVELTIYENLVCSSKNKLSRALAKQFLVDFSSYLSENLDQTVSKLSGGQKQVLALAMCLSRKPKLFLLDEHTSALDPQKAHEVMQLIKKYKAKNQDLTIIMTTHNLDDAIKYGDRIIAIKQGQIAADIRKDGRSLLKKEQLLNFY